MALLFNLKCVGNCYLHTTITVKSLLTPCRKERSLSRRLVECLPLKWRMDQVGKRRLGLLMWKMAKVLSQMTQVFVIIEVLSNPLFFFFFLSWTFFFCLVPHGKCTLFSSQNAKRCIYHTVGHLSQSISVHPHLRSTMYLHYHMPFLSEHFWFSPFYTEHTRLCHILCFCSSWAVVWE